MIHRATSDLPKGTPKQLIRMKGIQTHRQTVHSGSRRNSTLSIRSLPPMLLVGLHPQHMGNPPKGAQLNRNQRLRCPRALSDRTKVPPIRIEGNSPQGAQLHRHRYQHPTADRPKGPTRTRVQPIKMRRIQQQQRIQPNLIQRLAIHADKR